MRRNLQHFICAAILLHSLPVHAENHESHESCEIVSAQSTVYQEPPTFPASEQNNTNISANTTKTDKSGFAEFDGNVIIERHQLKIKANHASYNPANEHFKVTGNVHVDIEGMAIDASSGELFARDQPAKDQSNEGKATVFNDIQFFMPKNKMRGIAGSIISSGNNKTDLKQARITTCDPVEPDWRLDADLINIDHKEEYGSADNVVLRFKEVPFIYIPYMEFPIGDRRRSGLLVPEFGDSGSRGFEFSIPWYWNIATNHDAIIAPHHMNKRGTQLDAQYRFLTESSTGEIVGAFLPEDDMTAKKRYQYQYLQKSKITANTNLGIDIQDVSDTEYFNDFSSNLAASSQTHLNKSANLNYSSQHWQANALAQTFETLDQTILLSNRPYRRLPQLSLKGTQGIDDSGLEFMLDSEWVYFEHEDKTLVRGSRATLEPGMHWLLDGASWYLDPSVHLSHTQYDVEDGSGTKLNLNSRSLTTSAIDAGLFFERSLSTGLIQTLEPRLYYLNTPFKDQSALPIFDTSLPTFSTTQLFRDNRFNGGDRIGDANQLTMAISSRIINPTTGNEYLRASLGQITYFDDRRVTLSGIPQKTSRSDIIAELGGNLYNWDASTSVQWDSEASRSIRENFLLHYKSDSSHIFNLGYRMDRSVSTNEIKQADISFVTPISKKMTTFARWNYSLKDNSDIDVIGGFSYDSCCWSVQLLAQRHLQSSDTATREYDTAVMIQLVLKGLGSVSGDRVSKTLGSSILGYGERN